MRTKSVIVRMNPASPDTPTGKPLGWSGTILVFPMKNKNLCSHAPAGDAAGTSPGDKKPAERKES